MQYNTLCFFQLPENLDWEFLINKAFMLMQDYPAKDIDKDAAELIKHT